MVLHLLSLLYIIPNFAFVVAPHPLPCGHNAHVGDTINETTVDGRRTVHIAVILSQDNVRLFSTNKSRAAIELAIEEAEKTITKSLHFEVLQYAESK